MSTVSRQALSVFVSGLLVFFPLLGQTADLVGVARAEGHAEINGTQIPGETNVYSGDQLSTRDGGTLTVIVTPQERFQLSANSTARVRLEGETILVNLEEGELQFWTAGRIRVGIVRYDVTVRPRGEQDAIALVSTTDPEKAYVSAMRGTVEVVAPDVSMLVHPGQTAQVTEEPGRLQGAGVEAADGSRKKKIAIALVSAGVAAAVVLAIVLDDNPVVSPSVP